MPLEPDVASLDEPEAPIVLPEPLDELSLGVVVVVVVVVPPLALGDEDEEPLEPEAPMVPVLLEEPLALGDEVELLESLALGVLLLELLGVLVELPAPMVELEPVVLLLPPAPGLPLAEEPLLPALPALPPADCAMA